MAPLMLPGHASTPSPLGTVVWVSTVVHDTRQRVLEASRPLPPPSDAVSLAPASRPGRPSKRLHGDDQTGHKGGFSKRGRGTTSRSFSPSYLRFRGQDEFPSVPALSMSAQEFPSLAGKAPAQPQAQVQIQSAPLRLASPTKSTTNINKENAHLFLEALQS